MFNYKSNLKIAGLFFGIAILILPLNVFSKQNTKQSKLLFERALLLYHQDNYSSSYDLLLKSIKYDSTNISTYLLISDICIEQKLPEKRIWAMEKIIAIDSVRYPSAFKFLGNEYFRQGLYDQALLNLKKYKSFTIQSDSIEIEKKIRQCIENASLIYNSKAVDIIHLDSNINTSKHEYWPAISIDDSTLFFTRLIVDDKKFAYERIYFSTIKAEKWGDSDKLIIGGDSLINEGSMCFSANGEWLFFTACGRSDGYGSCDIYYSRKVKEIWSSPKNAGGIVNSSKWEAQPAVASDGSVLYFASSRKGGFGKNDIWASKMKLNDNGELAFYSPENLGSSINTEENDFSPFIHADNRTLYFASEGRICLGGSDLFLSRKTDDRWTEAVNMGFPLNSRFDEDGLVVSPTAKVALFSSNRMGSLGGSKDIYQLTLPSEYKPEKMGYIKGYVYNVLSLKKLDATIEFTNLNSGKVQNINSTQSEGYTALIEANSTYALNICEPEYLFYSQHFNLKNPDGFVDATLLDLPLNPVKVGDKVVLNNIFFDFDSFLLRSESLVELQSLIRFLKLNPRIKIEISGHTDNQGAEEYNLKLSENRAKAIWEYLISKVSADRVSYKGYGAKFPVESNDEEIGRMKNRRSELRIVAF